MPPWARPGCSTARRARIAVRPGWARRRKPRSWRCAAGVSPGLSSLASSADRSRPWAWSCAAAASAGSTPSTPSPGRSGINASGRASSSTSTSRSSAGSRASATASPATAPAGRARGVGWEFLHVCVDDASRLAYTEILPDERKESAVAFLERALAWFAGLGVAVERVMTDNGSAYASRAFREACATARVKHRRTRPYTPRTNGKAERFIQTSLREWAYLQAFNSSAERTAAMQPWLHAYNRHRPHSALGGKPPFTRL